MTTIAWDGTTLAVDRQCVNNGWPNPATKLFRLQDGSAVAGAGELSFIMQMVDWLESGAVPANFPAAQRDKDDWQPVIVVRDKTVFRYERTPFPLKQEGKFYAAGSGRDFALATMHLGHDAVKAVEVASALDVNTGMGVDTVRFA